MPNRCALLRVFSRPAARAVVVAALALLPGAVLAQGYGGTVTDMLVRGESLLSQGRPREALVQFQEARTLCPTAAETVKSYQGEARARLLLNEPLPAAGLLEEAVALHPGDPRAADLLFAAAQARQRAGDVDKAIDLLRDALEKSPTPDLVPKLRVQLAQAYRLRARHDEAIATLAGFEEAFPKHALLPHALYTRAIASHDAGKPEIAEPAYRALIAQFPGTPAATEARFELALVLQETGRAKEAADLYREYTSLNPSSPVTATALERAADLLLFRAPAESRQLYDLAKVKAEANPKPPAPDLALSRWLPLKRAAAGVLERTWLAALLGVAALALVGGAGVVLYRAARRFRRRPPEGSRPAETGESAQASGA